MLDLFFFFTSHSVRWLSSASQLPSLPYFQRILGQMVAVEPMGCLVMPARPPTPWQEPGLARCYNSPNPLAPTVKPNQTTSPAENKRAASGRDTSPLLLLSFLLTLLMYPTYNLQPFNTLSFASYLANTYRPLISSQLKHPAFTILNSSQSSPLPKQVLGQSSDGHTRL